MKGILQLVAVLTLVLLTACQSVPFQGALHTGQTPGNAADLAISNTHHYLAATNPTENSVSLFLIDNEENRVDLDALDEIQPITLDVSAWGTPVAVDFGPGLEHGDALYILANDGAKTNLVRVYVSGRISVGLPEKIAEREGPVGLHSFPDEMLLTEGNREPAQDAVRQRLIDNGFFEGDEIAAVGIEKPRGYIAAVFEGPNPLPTLYHIDRENQEAPVISPIAGDILETISPLAVHVPDAQQRRVADVLFFGFEDRDLLVASFYNANTVAILRRSNESDPWELVRLLTMPRPNGLAFDYPSHLLFVGCEGDAQVRVFDLRSDEIGFF